jgi:hypothetical protein
MRAPLVRLIPFLPVLLESAALLPLRTISDRPAPPISKPRDTASSHLLVTLMSPLKSLLKPSQPSMALITFKLTATVGHRLPHRPTTPIKGGDPCCYSPHLLLSFSPSLHPQAPPSLSSINAIARPPHHRPSSGEVRDGFPVLPSLFCALGGELSCPRVAGGHALTSAPPRPGNPVSTPQPIHAGPCAYP